MHKPLDGSQFKATERVGFRITPLEKEAIEDWLMRHPGRTIVSFFRQSFACEERTLAITEGRLRVKQQDG